MSPLLSTPTNNLIATLEPTCYTLMMNVKRQLDEFGRIVYDDEVPAPPIPTEDQAPFWDGWSSEKMGLNGEEVRLSDERGTVRLIASALHAHMHEYDCVGKFPLLLMIWLSCLF